MTANEMIMLPPLRPRGTEMRENLLAIVLIYNSPLSGALVRWPFKTTERLARERRCYRQALRGINERAAC